jgi:hypothetical protein
MNEGYVPVASRCGYIAIVNGMMMAYAISIRKLENEKAS